MRLTVRYPVVPKRNSLHASLVMDHFGLDWETEPLVIADDLDLPIRDGDVVLFGGESGSGKSSLMREVGRRLRADHSDESDAVVNLDTLDLGDRILADRLPLPFAEALQLLAACGLGEAALLLRTPRELSDGQRYRFRLALGIALNPRWLVADEFTAPLDRRLASVIAFNLAKLARRRGFGLLLATTHVDVAADLEPDLHVVCSLDGSRTVTRSRDEPTEPGAVKKKRTGSNAEQHPNGHQDLIGHRSPPVTVGSAPAPDPIGRTSPAGITARMASGSSAS